MLSSHPISTASCAHCLHPLGERDLVCRNCGEMQAITEAHFDQFTATDTPPPAASAAASTKRNLNGSGSISIGTRRRIAFDDTITTQRIDVASIHDEEDDKPRRTTNTARHASAAATGQTTTQSSSALLPSSQQPQQPLKKRDTIRISPFIFLLLPTIFFYASSLLASFTLHFGSGSIEGTCPSSLRTFLWGSVLIGYLFLLGFIWLLIGPRVDSLLQKWAAIAFFTILLGVLTGLGARQLLTSDTTDTCRQSAWFLTCSVITGFYCLFWIMLSCLIAYETWRSYCRAKDPTRGREMILGIGSGLNKIKIRPLMNEFIDVFERNVIERKLGGKKNRVRNEQAKKEAEKEMQTLLEKDEIKKDNFFGSTETEKRKRRGVNGSSATEVSLTETDKPSTMRIKSTSAVAPHPNEFSTNQNTARSTEKERGGEESKLNHPPSPSIAAVTSPLSSDLELGDDEDDPFASRIASNKALQETRRLELEELAKVQAANANQKAVAAQQQLNGNVEQYLMQPQLQPSPSPSSSGILRSPSTAATLDKPMKMVEWETSNRLENVKSFGGGSSDGEEEMKSMSLTPNLLSPNDEFRIMNVGGQYNEYERRELPPRFLPPLPITTLQQHPMLYPPSSSSSSAAAPFIYPPLPQHPYAATMSPEPPSYSQQTMWQQHSQLQQQQHHLQTNQPFLPINVANSSSAVIRPLTPTASAFDPTYGHASASSLSTAPIQTPQRYDPDDANRFSKLHQFQQQQQQQQATQQRWNQSQRFYPEHEEEKY